MVKMMFMVYRKPPLTRAQCHAEWMGEPHHSYIQALKAAGLRRYVQNACTGDERDGAPDGVGELWFDDPAAMERVLRSEPWQVMGKDGERFVDLERSYALIVDEYVRIE